MVLYADELGGNLPMLQFALAAALAAAILFVPGYLLLRAFCLDRAWSVALAPAASIAITSLAGEALAIVGLPGNLLTVAVAPSAVFAIIALVRGRKTDALSLPKLKWLHLGAYALVGIFIGIQAIIRPMGNPENYFAGGIDLVQHFNSVRAFVDSGILSSLKQSYYLADPEIDPILLRGFYPSGWHVVCALIVMVMGIKIQVAFNAVNIIVCTLVWTFGMCGLFSTIFEDEPHAPLTGALVASASAIFPWGFYTFGPIFSNLLSFTFVPALILLFMHVVRGGVRVGERVLAFVLFVVTLVGVVFSQPNAAFTAAVFLIPYLAWRIFSLKGAVLREGGKPLPAWASRLLGFLFLLACVGIWYGLLLLPALSGIIRYVWDYTTPVLNAILNALAFSNVYDFAWVAWQPALGVFALIGAVYTIVSGRYRWMGWTALFGQALCVVCLTTDPPIKNIFSGFWYTDPWRMAAMAIMCTLPLVLLGIVCLASGLEHLISPRLKGGHVAKGERVSTKPRAALAWGFVAVVFAVSAYWGIRGPKDAPEEGGFIVPYGESAWTCLRRTVWDTYGQDAPYSDAEEAFAEKVKEIADGAVVANDPYDGSVVAYGLSDLRTYWRYYYRYFGEAPETEESVYLRYYIADADSDPEVRRICRELGIEYVVRFSRDEFYGIFCRDTDGVKQFASLTSIDADTPGFEEVLSENGMHLYRITALDEHKD